MRSGILDSSDCSSGSRKVRFGAILFPGKVRLARFSVLSSTATTLTTLQPTSHLLLSHSAFGFRALKDPQARENARSFL